MKTNLNQQPFFIGQKVIANNNSYCFKKGDEFIVRRISKCQCGCDEWRVDVGVVVDTYTMECSTSGERYKSDNMFNVSCFTVKQFKNFPLINLSKLIEETSFITTLN